VSDAPQLAGLSRRLIETGLRWRWRPGAVAAQIRDEDSRVVVAREGEKIEGFAAMSFDFDERTAHLILLAVVPRRRREGLASALFGWLEVLARRGGVRRLRLEVREGAHPARALYARLGFREITRMPGYYQGREDALLLEKDFGRDPLR
jgi:ribosomal protein S18 acetylase RimI-like enzyme